MTNTGKIARLPHNIREELNHRLLNGQKGKSLLAWLNSLPEVQTVLAHEFDGRPINHVNLTAWKKSAYLHWQARQCALDLIQNLGNEPTTESSTLLNSLTTRLAHWAALQVAATAHVLTSERDSRKKWADLHILCANICRLRRGDLHAERLDLEREWLALEKTNTADQREKDFWIWTKREDIAKKTLAQPGTRAHVGNH